MNVTVDNLGPCKKLVRVEVEAQTVDAEFETMVKNFQRQVAFPGFRAGKAPRDMVLKKYEADILDELKKKLIGDAYRKAISEQKLDVVGYPDIEEIQFAKGQPLQFAATVETAPDFQLPEYKGLPAKRDAAGVTDEDADRAIEMLRSQQAKFEKVEREVQTGDFAVINYSATSDGKPLTDFAPTAKGLTERKAFWVQVDKDQFIPGFTEQLVGAKAGDKRTVNVDFPPDFVASQLGGLKGVYEVEVVEVKQRVLPPLDDTLAKAYGAENLEALRKGVRTDLQNELNFKKKQSIRNQVVEALLARVTCDLPESAVQSETRNVVYDLVSENQRRGIAKEAIEQQKDQIFNVAAANAKERVKAAFIFNKIADKEGIKPTKEEINLRILALAQRYQMTTEKFVKELQKRDGLPEILDQIIAEKVIDFLVEYARIEDVAPEPKPA